MKTPECTTTVSITCWRCHTPHEIVVNADRFIKWQNREGHIQTLLHDVSVADREMLISGTCDDCFKALFPEEEDDTEAIDDIDDTIQTPIVSDDTIKDWKGNQS